MSDEVNTASVFYVFGGLFALVAVVYFATEYVVYAEPVVKLSMLATLTVALFFTARYTEARDV